jgi:hypothetical protein
VKKGKEKSIIFFQEILLVDRLKERLTEGGEIDTITLD